jgi:hypothetical protein
MRLALRAAALVAIAVVVVAGVRCTLPSVADAVGFSCTQDADCGGSDLLVCRDGVCAVPGPLTDSGITPLPEAPFPIRVAMFLVEYPYAFRYGTSLHPLFGLYDSRDAGVIARQAGELLYGNFDAALVQWWNNGTPSDEAFALLLQQTAGKNIRWGLSFAGESPGSPLTLKEAGLLMSDVTHKYGSSPNLFRIDGKAVIYVHAAVNSDPCDVAARYVAGNRQYNDGQTFLILRAKTGKPVTDCALQPDAWMLDDFAKAVQTTAQVVNLTPGAVSADGGSPYLARSLPRFTSSLALAPDAGIALQVISSYNDWPEGSSIEPAAEYASDSGFGTYLDALHASPPR